MEPIIIFLYIYAFILGSCIASFMNVVIYRVPLGLNVAKGRSFCPNCHNTLKPYDMIPVFSWFILKGKCRFCKAPISPRYPIVEFMGGVLGMLCFYRFQFTWFTIIAFVLSMILLAIAWIDHDTMTIPDSLVIATLILAIVSMVLPGTSLIDRLIGFVCISIPMMLINVIHADSFGGGDIKLCACLGLLMGWKELLVGMFIAVILAGIYGSYLLITKKTEAQAHMAFGPFICFGCFLSFMYGNAILCWYLSLFGL